MITAPVSIYIFIVGLMVGSFLNVCIYRIPLEKNIVKGRSYCPSCGSLIPWYLNIPVVSYLLLRGRCKSCKAPISAVYPAVELCNAFLTLLAFLLYGVSLTALFLSALFSLLIVISMIDFRWQIIPDGLVIAMAVLGALRAAYQVIVFHDHWYTFVIGIFAASVPLLILGLIFPDGLGGGDVKFMAAAGLFAGWKLVLLGLFLGNLIALAVVAILFVQKKAARGTKIPFGPYLSLGVVCALLFGDALIRLYLQLFFGF